MKNRVAGKERFGYIFTICVLGLLLALFLTLFFTGVLSSLAVSPITNLPMGESQLLVEINGTQSSVAAFSFNGSIIPGEKLPQNINIKNQGRGDLFLRARAYVFTEDQGRVEMPLEVTSNWIKNEEDDYYYFSSYLPSNASIGLGSQIIINPQYAFNSSKKYEVCVVVEGLSSTLDAKNIWGVDPLAIE